MPHKQHENPQMVFFKMNLAEWFDGSTLLNRNSKSKLMCVCVSMCVLCCSVNEVWSCYEQYLSNWANNFPILSPYTLPLMMCSYLLLQLSKWKVHDVRRVVQACFFHFKSICGSLQEISHRLPKFSHI